jgi:hypothetical protein
MFVCSKNSVPSCWFGTTGTKVDAKGVSHETVRIHLGWRMTGMREVYPDPEEPRPWDSQGIFSLRRFERGHLVERDHFYLSFIPQPLEFEGPIMGILGFPNKRVPFEKVPTGFRLPPSMVSQWLELEFNLRLVYTALDKPANLPPLGIDSKVYPIPSQTRYHEVADTERQIIGRVRGARDLFVVLIAKISYQICGVMHRDSFDSCPTLWEKILKEFHLRIPPTFIDQLKNSHIPDPKHPRFGGWFTADMEDIGSSYAQFRIRAHQWNVPFVIRFPREQVIKIRKALRLEGDALLPDDKTAEEVVNFTNLRNKELRKFFAEQENLKSQAAVPPPPGTMPAGANSPEKSHPPVPHRGSGQIRGEEPFQFLARRSEEGKRKEEEESADARARRLKRQEEFGSHPYPSKNDRFPKYFEWELDENDWWRRKRIFWRQARACWDSDSGEHRDKVYNSFEHEVDICVIFEDGRIPQADPDVPYDYDPDMDTRFPSPIPFEREPDEDVGYFAAETWILYKSGTRAMINLSDRLRFFHGYAPPPGFALAPCPQDKITWKQTCHVINHDPYLNESDGVEVDRRAVTLFSQVLCNWGASVPRAFAELHDLDVDHLPGFRHLHSPLQVEFVGVTHEGYAHEGRTVRWYWLRFERPLPFHVVVAGALLAVGCIRLLQSGKFTPLELVRYLASNGARFRTLSADAKPLERLGVVSKSIGLGLRDQGFIPGIMDFDSYEAALYHFFRQPRSRAALMHGGIVWRLAIHYLGFEGIANVAAGPSFLLAGNERDAEHVSGLQVDASLCTDDHLTPSDLDLICGVYKVWNRE